jgi:hypothetical protein
LVYGDWQGKSVFVDESKDRKSGIATVQVARLG